MTNKIAKISEENPIIKTLLESIDKTCKKIEKDFSSFSLIPTPSLVVQEIIINLKNERSAIFNENPLMPKGYGDSFEVVFHDIKNEYLKNKLEIINFTLKVEGDIKVIIEDITFKKKIDSYLSLFYKVSNNISDSYPNNQDTETIVYAYSDTYLAEIFFDFDYSSDYFSKILLSRNLEDFKKEEGFKKINDFLIFTKKIMEINNQELNEVLYDMVINYNQQEPAKIEMLKLVHDLNIKDYIHEYKEFLFEPKENNKKTNALEVKF